MSAAIKNSKPDTFHAGDFVSCRSRYHRDQLQLPAGPGLVLEIKRNTFKIVYPNDKRCWLPRETLVRVRPEPGASPFLEKLNFILRRVNAHECEVRSIDGVHHLAAQIDRIDDIAVDELRTFLGPSFLNLAIVPEGMAFMQLEISWSDQSRT